MPAINQDEDIGDYLFCNQCVELLETDYPEISDYDVAIGYNMYTLRSGCFNK